MTSKYDFASINKGNFPISIQILAFISVFSVIISRVTSKARFCGCKLSVFSQSIPRPSSINYLSHLVINHHLQQQRWSWNGIHHTFDSSRFFSPYMWWYSRLMALPQSQVKSFWRPHTGYNWISNWNWYRLSILDSKRSPPQDCWKMSENIGKCLLNFAQFRLGQKILMCFNQFHVGHISGKNSKNVGKCRGSLSPL